MAAEIVSAYVGGNTVPPHELPRLIETVYSSLAGLATKSDGSSVVASAPAVPIKKSVTADYIICLEDGKKFKSLKRHLRTKYGMTPEQYRDKWDLNADYPMVAPNYAAARSQLAKQMGLGQQRRRRAK